MPKTVKDETHFPRWKLNAKGDRSFQDATGIRLSNRIAPLSAAVSFYCCTCLISTRPMVALISRYASYSDEFHYLLKSQVSNCMIIMLDDADGDAD